MILVWQIMLVVAVFAAGWICADLRWEIKKRRKEKAKLDFLRRQSR